MLRQLFRGGEGQRCAIVPGRGLGGFLPAGTDRGELELRQGAQRWNMSNRGEASARAGADNADPDLAARRHHVPHKYNPLSPRLHLAPPGIGSVQTFSGRHINVGLDRTIEMSAEDAQYYIPDGWIPDGWAKLAEWTTDEAV